MMEMQEIIVAFIILGALGFIGLQVWRKAKSFSKKNACGADCGCGETKKARAVKI